MRKLAGSKKEAINRYKIERGCEICGYKNNPAALSFDHIDPKTKYRTKSGRILHPSDMMKDSAEYSWNKIMAEIAKCRILCANCHMEITYPME